MTKAHSIERRHILRLSGALIGLSTALGACTAPDAIITGGVPDDYRLRHPIAITEANQSLAVFVGHGRFGLTPSQRSDVMGLARTWVREGTGAIVIDVPFDTPNARAAAATYGEIRSLLMAGGVPARGITQRHYQPIATQSLAPIKLNYTRIAATAGP